MCLSLPLISVMNPILKLWLIAPPPQSWTFCLLSLIYIQCNSLGGTLQNMVQATGKVKRYQLSNGIVKIMALPIVYIIYKCGGDVVAYLWTLILTSIVGLMVQLDAVRRLIDSFKISDYLKKVIMPALTAYLLPFLLSFYFSCMEMESLKMMETVAIMVVICLFSVWFIGFTGHERSWILNIAKSKLYR